MREGQHEQEKYLFDRRCILKSLKTLANEVPRNVEMILIQKSSSMRNQCRPLWALASYHLEEAMFLEGVGEGGGQKTGQRQGAAGTRGRSLEVGYMG